MCYYCRNFWYKIYRRTKVNFFFPLATDNLLITCLICNFKIGLQVFSGFDRNSFPPRLCGSYFLSYFRQTETIMTVTNQFLKGDMYVKNFQWGSHKINPPGCSVQVNYARPTLDSTVWNICGRKLHRHAAWYLHNSHFKQHSLTCLLPCDGLWEPHRLLFTDQCPFNSRSPLLRY